MYVAIRRERHTVAGREAVETQCPHCGYEWLEWSDSLDFPDYCPGCGEVLHKNEEE